MSDVADRPRSSPSPRTARFRIGALVALAVVVGLILWLALRDTGGSGSKSGSSASPEAVSIAQLQALATSMGHPVYWVGPQNGTMLELTRQTTGGILVRYLPSGAKVGTRDPHLTVATYPFPNAFAATQSLAKQKGMTSISIDGGGIAALEADNSNDVHLAYPGVDYQVEVFDPTPGAATHLISHGQVFPVGAATAAAPSLGGLRALAAQEGHPVYWLGSQPGTTIEVSQGTAGQVYLRYLPRGVEVGAKLPYLTVASYPFSNAFAATEGLARQNPRGLIRLAGGGLAVVDRQHPTSIYVAFPGSDVQTEVYDPSAAVARNVVSSGQVQQIR
jgi:hypothetical protein